MTVSMVKCGFIPSVRRSIWNYARVIFSVSECGFVLFLSLGSGCGKGKDDAKLFFWYFTKSGCSQYPSVLIHGTVASTSSSMGYLKPLFFLEEVPVCRVLSIALLIAKQLSPNLKGLKKIASCKKICSFVCFSAFLDLLKEAR